MSMLHSLLSTDCNELLICPYQNGIQIKPVPDTFNSSHFQKESYLHLNQLLNLPFLIYFYNCENKFELVNETTVSINGFNSIQETIGKKMSLVTSKEFAEGLHSNNHLVLSQQSTHFFDEEILHNDGHHIYGFSIKSPWYIESTLMGVFGISIPINNPSIECIERSLSCVIQTNFTKLVQKDNGLNQFIKKNRIGDVYFTSQQINVMRYLIRGNTAKVIAKKLNISPRTVEMHINNIKIKLGVKSKSELIDKIIDFLLSQQLLK
jgi:DNA-binding CsgD family transcriptional regulator